MNVAKSALKFTQDLS